MKYIATLLLCIVFVGASYAQEATDSTKHKLVVNGYMDTYYAAYSTDYAPNELQEFVLTNFKSKRFSVNMAQIALAYTGPGVRANLTLQNGDIARVVYPGFFEGLQEANLGFKLGNKWWFDAGIFANHIGAESFVPRDNWVNINTVNSLYQPRYAAGARLSYEPSEKFTARLWAVNAYNNLNDLNNANSVSVTLNYKPVKGVSINYANVIGEERLDRLQVTTVPPTPVVTGPSQFLFYNNAWIELTGNKTDLMLSADVATMTNTKGENIGQRNETGFYWNAFAMLRHRFSPAYSMTARVETMQDPDALFSLEQSNVNTGSFTGARTVGATLGASYAPFEGAYIRAAGRYLALTNGSNFVRLPNNRSEDERFEFVLSMGLSINKAFNW